MISLPVANGTPRIRIAGKGEDVLILDMQKRTESLLCNLYAYAKRQ